MEFKEGEVVRIKKFCNSSLGGKMYRLKFGYEDGSCTSSLIAREGIDTDSLRGRDGCSCSGNWELVTNYKSTNKLMELKEKFTLALTSEPKKSFRKAGITNGDDILTDDGMKVFLSWLLHSKYAEEFKAEVVDEMLKEEK